MKPLFCLLALSAAAPALGADLWEGYDHYEVIAANGHLNCREAPDATARVVVTFASGDTIWVENVMQDSRGKPWFLVPGGETGVGSCYVRASTEYLAAQENGDDYENISGGAFKVVDRTGLNCRRSPGTQAPVVLSYGYRDFVNAVAMAYDTEGAPWFQTSDGCYVRANGKYLSEVQYD